MSGGGSKEQVVGYKYYIDGQFVICDGPIDKFKKIIFDKEKIIYSSNSTLPDPNEFSLTIADENLFGGEKREGGIAASVDFNYGARTQPVNNYLSEKLGPLTSAFRNVSTIVVKNGYWGMNPYLKSPSIEAQRIFNNSDGSPLWYPEKVQIGLDRNPVHIILECITNATWGAGYSNADCDLASFTIAADKLYEENFGLSLSWENESSIIKFISQILEHIDAALYLNEKTGLITLKLVRDDYDENSLFELNENENCLISKYNIQKLPDLNNTVTIKYFNLSERKPDSITVANSDLVQQQKKTNSITRNYPGISNADLAARIASRELLASSTPLISANVNANRKAAHLNLGDVFKLVSDNKSINSIMRVIEIDKGTMNNNVIKIKCVEDIFADTTPIFAPVDNSLFVPPNTDPQPVTNTIIREANYWELVQRLGDTAASNISNGQGYVLVTGERPTSQTINASMYISAINSSSVELSGTTDFCSFFTINENLDYTQSTFLFNPGTDFDLINEGDYCEINDEYMKIVTIDNNTSTMTVLRAILDTQPQLHISGDQAVVWESFGSSNEIKYLEGETVYTKLTPLTSGGELSLSNASTASVLMSNRAFRPYPPARILINSSYRPANITDDISIDWNTRNRITGTSQLVGWNENSNYGQETGNQFELILTNTDNNNIIANVLTASTSYTLTVTDEFTSTMNNATNIRLELRSLRDGEYSRETYIHEFTRTIS